MRFPQRALGITLLVLAGALVALLAYRTGHRTPLVARGGPSAAAPAATAVSPGAEAGAGAAALTQGVIPQNVPDVRMNDLAGHAIALSQYRGHPLLINFWATWCPPCRHEMPLLQQLWTRYQPQGLRVVGIAVDTREAVAQYLQQTSVSYPLLVGEDQATAAASRFGIEPVLPFSVFADARGRIVAVKIGELHRAEAEYIIGALQRVSEGRQTLPQARLAIAAQMHQLAVQRSQPGPSATPPP